MTYCTNCGNDNTDERFCSVCGTKSSSGFQDDIPQNQYQNRRYNSNLQVPLKNPGMAALLATLIGLLGFSGIGHIYIGKVGKGVAILLVVLILEIIWYMDFFFGGGFYVLILAIPITILWIWQIFDAHHLAKEYNAWVIKTGLPPDDW